MVSINEARQQITQQRQEIAQARQQIQSFNPNVMVSSQQLRRATPMSQAKLKQQQELKSQAKELALKELKKTEEQFESQIAPIEQQINIIDKSGEQFKNYQRIANQYQKKGDIALYGLGKKERNLVKAMSGGTIGEQTFRREVLKSVGLDKMSFSAETLQNLPKADLLKLEQAGIIKLEYGGKVNIPVRGEMSVPYSSAYGEGVDIMDVGDISKLSNIREQTTQRQMTKAEMLIKEPGRLLDVPKNIYQTLATAGEKFGAKTEAYTTKIVKPLLRDMPSQTIIIPQKSTIGGETKITTSPITAEQQAQDIGKVSGFVASAAPFVPVFAAASVSLPATAVVGGILGAGAGQSGAEQVSNINKLIKEQESLRASVNIAPESIDSETWKSLSTEERSNIIKDYNKQIDENIKSLKQTKLINIAGTAATIGAFVSPLAGKAISKVASNQFIKEAGLTVKELRRLNELKSINQIDKEYYTLKTKSLNYLQKKGDKEGVKVIQDLFPSIEYTKVPYDFAASRVGSIKPKEGKVEVTPTTAQEIRSSLSFQAEREARLFDLDVRATKLGLKVESARFPERNPQFSPIQLESNVFLGAGEKALTKAQKGVIVSDLEGKGLMASKEEAINFISEQQIIKGGITIKPIKQLQLMEGSLGDIPKVVTLPKLKYSPGLLSTYKFKSVSFVGYIKKGSKAVEISRSYLVSPYTGRLLPREIGKITSKGNRAVIDVFGVSRKSTRMVPVQAIESPLGQLAQPELKVEYFKAFKPLERQFAKVKGMKSITLNEYTKLREYNPQYLLARKQPTSKRVSLYEFRKPTFVPKKLRGLPLTGEKVQELILSSEPSIFLETRLVPQRRPGGIILGVGTISGTRTPFLRFGISQPQPRVFEAKAYTGPKERIVSDKAISKSSFTTQNVQVQKSLQQIKKPAILSVLERRPIKVSLPRLKRIKPIETESQLYPYLALGTGALGASLFAGTGKYELTESISGPLVITSPKLTTSLTPRTETTQRELSLVRTKEELIPLVVQEPRLDMRTTSLTKTKQQEIPVLVPKTNLAQRITEILQPRMEVKQITRPRITQKPKAPVENLRIPRPKIKIPKLPLIPEDEAGKKRFLKKAEKGIIPEIRRRGKFTPYKPLSLFEAIRFGRARVGQTLAASVRFREAATGKLLKINLPGFTTSKRDLLVSVQPRRKRLSSLGEVREIQISRRNKGRIFTI